MRIAIIGCGNLGSALAKGLLQSGSERHELFVYDPNKEKTDALQTGLAVSVVSSGAEAARNAEVVLCVVKPKNVAAVLGEIRSAMESAEKIPLLISAAAGVSVEALRKNIGPKIRVLRAMPNVACLIGQGVTGIYGERQADLEIGERIFQSVGDTLVCTQESEINVVTALGAGGPAFIFVAIEALADGGVRMGLTREQALHMAASMTKGAAALMLETGQHPAQLKDSVASPGGTTIAGLHILEKSGFRGALISAVEASTKRAAEQS